MLQPLGRKDLSLKLIAFIAHRFGLGAYIVATRLDRFNQD